ncbi:MafI family immunity protein [Lacisediminihabitans sp.]|jgi:hypothetical protein|uniref:MafI family immunity protein n=1 Tax=Lacisediminihabitans sp. TaxID=2787631 RepID=UPI002F954F04
MNEAEGPSYFDRSQDLRTVLDHAVELPPNRSAFMRELIDVGELGLALTILCENLDELDAPVSASDRQIINALAKVLHAERYARYLDDNPLRSFDGG